MNIIARFDESPAMTLQDIKETKRYVRTDVQTDNVKTVYPPQTKSAGGIIILPCGHTSIYYTLLTKCLYVPSNVMFTNAKSCECGSKNQLSIQ